MHDTLERIEFVVTVLMETNKVTYQVVRSSHLLGDPQCTLHFANE
jgi:hypothetical protein